MSTAMAPMVGATAARMATKSLLPPEDGPGGSKVPFSCRPALRSAQRDPADDLRPRTRPGGQRRRQRVALTGAHGAAQAHGRRGAAPERRAASDDATGARHHDAHRSARARPADDRARDPVARSARQPAAHADLRGRAAGTLGTLGALVALRSGRTRGATRTGGAAGPRTCGATRTDGTCGATRTHGTCGTCGTATAGRTARTRGACRACRSGRTHSPWPSQAEPRDRAVVPVRRRPGLVAGSHELGLVGR